MDIKAKRLLVLGGTRLSCEIIKEAQKNGVYVIVTDYLKDSPGKIIADKSFMVSTTNIKGVVNLIREEHIDGVITGFIEMLLPYYQKICDESGLPCYATKDQIDIATNKIRFRDLCQKFNVPVMQDYELDYPLLPEEIKHLPYPVLVKPVDCGGGRGIFICRDSKEFINKYQQSLQYSSLKKVIVQKFINAKEATIFYIIQDGEICLSALADRHIERVNKETIPLPVAYTFPSKHLSNYQGNLNSRVIEMFKSVGIRNGMIFIQSFVENGHFTFYEMGFRLSSVLECKIIAKLNHLNPLTMMINFALTGSMYDLPIQSLLNPNHEQLGFNLTFLAKPGKVGEIIGLEDVASMKNVIDAVETYNKGHIIPEDSVGTLKQVILRVLGFAKSETEMASIMKEIQNIIKIRSETGEDMLLPVFNTDTLDKLS